MPQEARYINFGATIKEGTGSLWIADLSLSEVSKDVPLTENGDDVDGVKKGPTNFELAPSESDVQLPEAWSFHSSPASAASQFKSGLKLADNRPALWISSDADLVPDQGEKSNQGGTFTQTFNCVQWRGRRVRFSADVKCKDVGDWCGLMMWVRGMEAKTLAFTTMYDLALSGNSDWQRCSVILDVPPIACKIILGATLKGNGEVFFSNLSFDEAGPDDATTDRSSRAKNLTFAE